MDQNKQKNLNNKLLVAAREGKSDDIKQLILEKAQVDIVDKDGNTPLMIASGYGHKNCLEPLLDNGANANYCNYYRKNIFDHRRYTALIYATAGGHKGCVKRLLLGGAHPDVDHEILQLRDSALCWEIVHKRVGRESYTLNCINIIRRQRILNEQLRVSVKNNVFDEVSQLLDLGAQAMHNSARLLTKAIDVKNVDIMKLLLKYKTDPSDVYYKYRWREYLDNEGNATEISYYHMINPILASASSHGGEIYMKDLLSCNIPNLFSKKIPVKLGNVKISDGGNTIGEVALINAVSFNRTNCAQMLLEYAKEMDLNAFKGSCQVYFGYLPEGVYKKSIRKKIMFSLLSKKLSKDYWIFMLPKPILLNMIVKQSLGCYFPSLRKLLEIKNASKGIFLDDNIFEVARTNDMKELLQKYKDMLSYKEEKSCTIF